VVDVDRGALGSHSDGDEVAIPRAELVEHEQQLLALGAAGCSPQPLLGLAGGEVLTLELLLGRGARLVRALPGRLDHGLCGLGRNERRIAVDRPSELEELGPPLGRLRVEQALHAIEPPGGHPREGGLLVRAQSGRALGDRGAHRLLREPPEEDGLAP
jgi:hypothetical protein